MFKPKVTVTKELMSKITEAAKIAGCSNLEEFVERALNKEADRVLSQGPKREMSAAEVEEIAAKMKGLGYLE
ncbi:MAG: hypothetical protein K1X83_05975 [Oligoflexia bacterium]|nr:hypothetical protein [Oligoflexia bacterium]